MGDHHKLKYKSKTDTNLFLTRVKEEQQQEVRRESSEAHLTVVEPIHQPPHHAHSSCIFHVNFFHQKPHPKALEQAHGNNAENVKPQEYVRLRRNEGQPHLFNSANEKQHHVAPRRNDGQPSLPQLRIK